MLTEWEFDNLLVDQKNRIIELVDAGRLLEARAALAVVRDMWVLDNYGYKIQEIEARMRNAEGDDGRPWTFAEIMTREG